MARQKRDDRVRFNLMLHRSVKEGMEETRRRMDADSMGEVVRRTVDLYATLLDIAKDPDNPAKLMLRDPDGTERIVELF